MKAFRFPSRLVTLATLRWWSLAGGAAMLLAVAIAHPGQANDADEDTWKALQSGGVIAMLRHARAPGTGDPAGFRLGACETQRNLNEVGRAQARALGGMFRERGVSVDGVYSSQWCRCLDTASLMALGEVNELPSVNSFFQRPERKAPQMAALRSWLAENGRPQGSIVLVTHQVVISALTGVFPRSGETVVFQVGVGGKVSVIGRLPPPE